MDQRETLTNIKKDVALRVDAEKHESHKNRKTAKSLYYTLPGGNISDTSGFKCLSSYLTFTNSIRVKWRDSF